MSGFVVMYRENVRGTEEWSPWLRLSGKVHETIEDSNKELEEEIKDDEEWGTGDCSYIYRTMTEKEAGNTTSTDYGHVSPEDVSGKITVDRERWEELLRMESELKKLLGRD